jgi:hypothetical protein
MRPQPATSATLALFAPELGDRLRQLCDGAVGRTVRCTPRRWTVCVDGDPVLFGKWRQGGCAAAAREWHWLHLLPLLGFRVPRPLAWLGDARRSVLVTAAVAGRPMDVWLAAATAEGWLDEVSAYAVRHVAPVVRRLHASGLVYRDLYWNHVFAVDPRGDEPPTLIDVERVFRPRFRRRRWVVKDLAGLLASLPVPLPGRALLRFLRSYVDGAALEPRLVAAVVQKAARIRRHSPRFG